MHIFEASCFLCGILMETVCSLNFSVYAACCVIDLIMQLVFIMQRDVTKFRGPSCMTYDKIACGDITMSHKELSMANTIGITS